MRARSFSASAANKVQHEWVRVRAKLDADEGHLLDHETGHEGNVAAQPIELGDDDRRLPVAAGLGQGGAQLRATIERDFARFDLDILQARQAL